eukprot:gnl/TRDRNA2_/TRDRNA2_145604_c0_seq1.p1 gnl/TRDRNA2_/TRDRNA2_145604_c0~~gnl/TRDRNA2_/TRDRNA2_145604_c0_seq1.p1  ORF type:complete len:529 (+),score=86.23 gnl/TRDRNA2_/TRDRNA2_145604_c0_seq1:68-1654(+)
MPRVSPLERHDIDEQPNGGFWQRLTRMFSEESLLDGNRRQATLLSYDHMLVGPAGKRSNNRRHTTATHAADSMLQGWECCTYEPYAPSGTPGISERRILLQMVDMFSDIAHRHHLGLLGIFASFLMCLIVDAVHSQFIDGSFFKASGLLLAVLLSLRAKNAVTRRQKMMQCIIGMINSARNILWLAGGQDLEKRRVIRSVLAFIFAEVAAWIARRHTVTDEGLRNVSVWHSHGATLDDLPEKFQKDVFILRGKAQLRVTPRPLMLCLRDVCDAVFDQRDFDAESTDQISHVRRWHRNIDAELNKLTDLVDLILIYDEELYNRQFRWLIGSLIFLYVSLYPWCVQNENGAMLGGTTLGMAFVFYGLNSMSQQLEEPFNKHGAGFNLGLTFQKAFNDLDEEEKCRERCRVFLRRALDKGCRITELLHDEFVNSEVEDREAELDAFARRGPDCAVDTDSLKITSDTSTAAPSASTNPSCTPPRTAPIPKIALPKSLEEIARSSQEGTSSHLSNVPAELVPKATPASSSRYE